MAQNLISIITPTKNSAYNLDITLISIANQGYKNFEHIIIDSKSTDGTLSIIEKYKRIYPILSLSEQDCGIAEAFNKGIRLSTGRWLIFLGAGDELIRPNVLEEMAKNLVDRENCLIVWGNITHKASNGQIGKTENGNFRKNKLKRFMCLPHQAAFHNKRLFSTFGLYDINFKVAMDYDLCLRIYDYYDFNGYVNINVAYMLSGGISQTNNNAIEEYYLVQKKNHIWKFRVVPKILFYWAHFKNWVKRIIHYNSLGFEKISH